MYNIIIHMYTCIILLPQLLLKKYVTWIFVGKSPTDELTTKEFQDCGKPFTAFQKLSARMEQYFTQIKFRKIRRACIQLLYSPSVGQFPIEFTEAISRSNNLEELLDVLSESNYWNWIDIRFMEAIVNSLEIPAANNTLKSYKSYVSAFKLEDVLPQIPVHLDAVGKYVTIEEKFSSSSAKTVTVGHILKHWHDFSYKVCDINPNIPKLCSINTGCFKLLWSIPRECALHAYKSALVNVKNFESILYLKIEYYPTIYSPEYSHTDHILPSK